MEANDALNAAAAFDPALSETNTLFPYGDLNPVYTVVDNTSLLLRPYANSSSGETGDGGHDPLFARPIWQTVIIITICSFIIIMTILGNALVCLSVALVRKLQTPSNLLIVSLAVSDCLVGLLVMPFALMLEVTGEWKLGRIACDAWTSSDVLLCTASILNLCAISIDRYFVITRPFQYAIKRTPRRMVLMILCVWVLSALISLPPLFGLKETLAPGECHLSESLIYQCYATFCAFYIPLIAMIFIYYRIYKVSHKIAKQEAKSKPAAERHGGHSSGLTTPLRRDSHEVSNHIFRPNGKSKGGGSGYKKHSDASKSSSEMIPKIHSPHDGDSSSTKSTGCWLFPTNCCIRPRLKGKESKATKTLGVIMGAFTACWLPFFILAVITPFLNLHDDLRDIYPPWLHSIFLWLGYTNSFLNPVIYARFNRDFRQPFKLILLCHCRNINSRMRINTYTEQYGSPMPHMHSKYSLKPPQTSTVKYESQGQTIVHLGNGNSMNNNGAKL